MRALPLSAASIKLEWPIAQGGIGASACTDETGQTYIKLYRLIPEIYVPGLAVEYPKARVMIDAVAGYDQNRRIIVFVDAEVTYRGLDLKIIPPPSMAMPYYTRHLFRAWE
jgi:hypothetical protein